ncbi:adenylate/guanylate cyclase domain-containing protein (plasmid) [Haloterrigena salifodinae]|uniref:Adenylate/guanylate cyclase domain-containing protein n=1 Tax=Haloterrigena salifodinae TaxID=2675099 RepID=A0A8T8E6F1_9EURY|nr:adenylate/guanylate cyclase domain-containing protein [Haloterrigena salifodinae]QRV17444.1 adenylate/guanylate cyclase domain-containing protein [Haloterrigena salifodinae]
MLPDSDEISERIEERAETVEERLDHIPSGYKMPDLEDMTISSAKKFNLGIVFIDINDFTAYSSRNDEWDILFMLNMFIPEIMEAVRDHNGYFEKNTGDGILAYFGAGDSDEDTAVTVFDYVATVKYILANYVNPLLEEKGVEPITISAGATYGTTHISRVGVHSMNRLSAVGINANIASKLESASGKDEYYFGEGLVRHAGDHAGTEHVTDLGQFENYTWTDSGYPFHHYNFHGVWTGTETSNLE